MEVCPIKLTVMNYHIVAQHLLGCLEMDSLMASSFIVNLICLGRSLDFTIFDSLGVGSKESSAMNDII